MILGNSEVLLNGERELLRRVGFLRADDLRVLMELSVFFDDEVEVVLKFSVGEWCVFVRFSGVRMLLFPDVGMSNVVFSELSILDVRDEQLEGVRYRASDREASGFLCECSVVEVGLVG